MKFLTLTLFTAALLAASPTIPTDQVQQMSQDLNGGHGDDHGDGDDHGHMPKTPEPASFVLGALGIAGILVAQRLSRKPFTLVQPGPPKGSV